MKKQFLFNIVLIIVLNALIKPLWVFGIDRTVQNIVGQEAYGFYFALFNFSLLFNALLDLGISNFNNRSIAQNSSLFQTYFPGIFTLKLFLGVFYLVVCLCAALFLGYSANAFNLLLILALNQLLASFLLFLRSNISGLQMFTTDSLLSVTDRLLMILLCSILLWTNLFPFEINVRVFALFQTFAYLLACGIALTVLTVKKEKLSFTGIGFSVGLLKKSWPFALLAFLMVIYNRVDAVLLERMLSNGPAAAGVYAKAYRIFDAINMISVLFASLLLPMFARLLAEKRDVRPLIKLSFSILISGTLIVAVILSYFSLPFLNILYKGNNHHALWPFLLLMMSVVPVSLSYIFGTLLTSDGRLFHLNAISAAALILNVVLNLTLIPQYSFTGAAIAAFASQLFVAAVQIFICRKLFSLHVSWVKFVPFVFLVLSGFLLSFVFDHLSIHVLWKIFFTGSVSVALVFVLKIIDIEDIYNH